MSYAYVVLDIVTFVFSVTALFFGYKAYKLVGKEKETLPWKLIMLLLGVTLLNALGTGLALSGKFCRVWADRIGAAGGAALREFCIFTYETPGVVYPSSFVFSKVLQTLTAVIIFAICYASFNEYSRLLKKFEE